jgi:hypothetical protein
MTINTATPEGVEQVTTKKVFIVRQKNRQIFKNIAIPLGGEIQNIKKDIPVNTLPSRAQTGMKSSLISNNQI